MVTPVIAYLTMKGGVGKTTLAANLTRAIADAQKRKILLIDGDAQCNLSQVFLSDEEIEAASSRSLYQAFDTAGRSLGAGDIKEAIYTNPSNGSTIDFIVGSFDTFELNAVATPVRQTQAAQRFKAFIEQAKTEYDLIAIDTNPSATFVTMQVLANANFLVAPITFDAFSMQGIHLVVKHLRERYDWLANPDRIAIVANKVARAPSDSELKRLQREEDKIRERYGRSPNLARCVRLERVHASNIIANRASARGFIADHNGSADGNYAKVVADFDAVASNINIGLNDAFANADRPAARNAERTDRSIWRFLNFGASSH